jgi:serine/threonine-protein kinase PknK
METPLLPVLPGYDEPELIAHGTTALVFRAVQTRVNRLVAIKVITIDTGPVPVNAERELATTVALSSQPHIVSIIDTGYTDDDRPYIVMEYCEGGSYAQILKSSGPLPIDDVLEVGVKIGEALHAAHLAGIVHRDVKPSNILRSRFGPALADFGIARAPEELASTLTREMMTPHHASPEALLHQAQSGLSDVYSLASTMWTLLIGHPPFVEPSRPSMDIIEFRDRVLHDRLPGMPRGDMPDWLLAEMTRAMAKLPADRHASAADFVDALRRGALGLATAAQPRAPAAGPPPAGSIHVPGLPAQAWPAPAGRISPSAWASAPARPTPRPTLATAIPAPPAPPKAAPPRTPDRLPVGPGSGSDSWTGTGEVAIDPFADIHPPGGTDPLRGTDGFTDAAAVTGAARHRLATWSPGTGAFGLPRSHHAEASLAWRRRLVAVLVAIIVVGLALSAVLSLLGPRHPTAASPTPSTGPSHSRAPGNVRLVDRGNSVVLTWTDPAHGTVSFIIRSELRTSGALRPLPLHFAPGGVTQLTITGLNPKAHYCFLVGAVYTTNDVRLAPYVCTAVPRRHGTATPSGAR